MCGIVGYIGSEKAAPILLDGLAKLEYRGYDSAGLAVYNKENDTLQFKKAVGRLKVLSELTHDGVMMPGNVGIGHTRWATHGAPSEANAHPHYNAEKTIAVVHNGIIENYVKLKEKLTKNGYKFQSETDTEVVAHLLDYYYKGNPLEAITKVMHRVEGSYALGIIFKDHPEELYAVRKDSPLIVGECEHGNIIASDVPAVLKYTRDVYFINNEEIAKLALDGITFYNVDEEEIKKDVTHIEWDITAAEKGGYEHFMLKEMYEQPKAVRDTLYAYLKNNKLDLSAVNLTEEEMKNISKIVIVACGSAYHTGVTAKYILEGISRVPVEVDLASEFRYRNPIFDKDSLVVIISQSGETADSLAALREAKANGIKVLAIVNVVGSSIAREADAVLYTLAGPEIAVATTKAYSAQLIAHYVLALKLAEVRGTIDGDTLESMIEDLKCLPDQIEMVLNNKERIQKFANRYLAAKDVFFIGRGIDYAISLEGSLKLKEISYIHSEAYAAGELKHGTISLIEEGTLVAAVVTQEDLYKKTVSNIVEVKSRGAEVIALTTDKTVNTISSQTSEMFVIPQVHPILQPVLGVLPLQLFAYYIALNRGCDIDKPRNLAKSVTVE